MNYKIGGDTAKHKDRTTILLYTAAGALLTLGAFTGCSGSAGPQFRIQTPYGSYDGSTSGTIDLDLRPYLPPAKTYTPDEQLEK